MLPSGPEVSVNEFFSKLEQRQRRVGLVCVGLDPVLSKLPLSITGSTHDRILRFLTDIVVATASIVCAFKANRAFFGREDEEGMAALKGIIAFIHRHYPDIPVILDAKEGDIGPTNEGYAIEAFDALKADAITLNPYLGGENGEAYAPFLERADKGLIFLCRTSNPGSDWLQCHGDPPLFHKVARDVATKWNRHGNCALVAGATNPADVGIIRQIVGDNMQLLVPGFGTQGGSVEKTIPLAVNSRGLGVIANNSSGILYASGHEDYATAAASQTSRFRMEIDRYRPVV